MFASYVAKHGFLRQHRQLSLITKLEDVCQFSGALVFLMAEFSDVVKDLHLRSKSFSS